MFVILNFLYFAFSISIIFTNQTSHYCNKIIDIIINKHTNDDSTFSYAVVSSIRPDQRDIHNKFQCYSRNSATLTTLLSTTQLDNANSNNSTLRLFVNSDLSTHSHFSINRSLNSNRPPLLALFFPLSNPILLTLRKN